MGSDRSFHYGLLQLTHPASMYCARVPESDPACHAGVLGEARVRASRPPPRAWASPRARVRLDARITSLAARYDGGSPRRAITCSKLPRSPGTLAASSPNSRLGMLSTVIGSTQ